MADFRPIIGSADDAMDRAPASGSDTNATVMPDPKFSFSNY